MRLGLALPQFGWGHPSVVAGFARRAEELGYDDLWVGDRLLTPTDPSDLYPGRQKPYPAEFTAAADPLVLWAAVAAVTSRIRLGSSTLNGPWYNSVLLARALTTIDALSGGRLDVGLGLGWMRDEYAVTQGGWSTRGRRLDELLDVLRAWWTENPVRYEGEFVAVPESVVDLRPAQPGGPPIWLGGSTPAALERVGRRADGYLALPSLPDDVQTRLWDTARRAAEAAGRDPDALRRAARLNPAEPAADAIRAALADRERAGFDGAFVDLTFCTSDVGRALELAEVLIAR